MDIGQYFEEAMAQNDSFGEDKSSLEKWNAIPDSENSTSGGFDCNICLETVQDPVVTLCGHLYCWPCMYKWLHFQSSSAENEDQQQQQCPVCKAEISQASLVPLYGKGQTTKPSKGKAPHLDMVIPRRPTGPACGVDNTANAYQTPQLYGGNYSYQSRQYHPNPGSYGGTTSSTFTPGGTTTNMAAETFPKESSLLLTPPPKIWEAAGKEFTAPVAVECLTKHEAILLLVSVLCNVWL
ncbi:hypothetical protein FH972_014606 [Carpinus fangiana]|uniref:E3 ubiquitin-protein ligase RMA n=1 Tax=Carpinus fangiana TaxID=176857 RepID=A0A5N6RA53_9ROSI|nr:hypothetical protein FH972_014606 [Carpinus fangiana]